MTIDFAYATGTPVSSGVIRSTPEDFRVLEHLSFELTGTGEHVFLQIRKTGLATLAIVEKLAKFSGISQRDIGYAGLKDKHAITTQWFSLYLPKKPEIRWQDFNSDRIEVLQVTRHERKCRIGALTHNSFEIVVRALSDTSSLESRIEILVQQGMPNYFGEQRFGHGQDNLTKVAQLFRGEITVKNKKKRGLYYSSARAWLFNLLLNERVIRNCYHQPICGDVMQLVGKRGYFSIDKVDEIILQRVHQRDIVPCGPLYGLGEQHVSGEAKDIEYPILDEWASYYEGLKAHGLELMYRPYTVFVENMAYDLIDDQTLKLCFDLPRGAYATSLLRELIQAS